MQTGEGALNEVQSMLQRVRDLAVQYNNGTLSTADKASITAEVAQLCAEISQIGSADAVQRHRPADRRGDRDVPGRRQRRRDARRSAGTQLFGTGGSQAVDSALFNFSGSTVTLQSIDAAIQNVSDMRSTYGSVQNRLDHTLNNLASYEENLTAANSRIKDVDMASEMVNFTKLQVLQQAGTAMLAQANQQPQSILSLLR